MAMRSFYNEVKGLKVKDLPAHIKPMFSVNYIKNTAKRAYDNCHDKYIEVKGIKVKDLPEHIKVKDLPAYIKPMFSVNYIKNTAKRAYDNYHDKYIETGSAAPLYHICFGGMIISYLVALPEERRHLAHQEHLAQQEHAKEHGGH